MGVTRFPIYNLFNIPEAIRKLANEIEENPEIAVHLVVVFDSEEGASSYRAFGKDFTRAYAIGLLEYGKALIMGTKNE